MLLQNKGMNRDLSISKAGESSAYENHNIRILAREHDTMLSVTNERGNKEISLAEDIAGILIGWNVLNRFLVLFSHEKSGESPDHIYRVEYTPDSEPEFEIVELFVGNLGFSEKNPIESVVYFESENIQKIYWVDGINVLRMMNFVDDTMPWYDSQTQTYDETYFDSNRKFDFGVTVEIEKDNSGNARPNGVIQYLLTYYNKHGQETGYAWMSDIVYLNPPGIGGSSDETNNNKITLRFSNLDESYYGYKVYSVFRSSYNGQVVAYLVAQGTVDDDVVVIDDAANQSAVDATSLLYLGSQNVKPGTLTHKDQTLFLGDLKSIGKEGYDELEAAIRQYMFIHRQGQVPFESNSITFMYSDDNAANGEISDIPFQTGESESAYQCQLELTSSQICSFKGGEKYRFGLVFFDEHGAASDVFWIGDKTNTLYPVIDSGNQSIQRIVAQCLIPSTVLDIAKASPLNFKSAQLVIAEASYADRSVKAQGILNPTMFNVWERYNGRVYSVPSWIARPKHAGYASDHFDVIHNSIEPTGEIECNYWEGSDTPTPYYQLKNYGTSSEDYLVPIKKSGVWDHTMVLYSINILLDGLLQLKISAVATVIKTVLAQDDGLGTPLTALNAFVFHDHSDLFANGQTKLYEDPSGLFTLEVSRSTEYHAWGSTVNADGYASMVRAAHANLTSWLRTTMNIPNGRFASEDTFFTWCNDININHRRRWVIYNNKYPSVSDKTVGGYDYDKADEAPEGDKNNRWYTGALTTVSDSMSYDPAFYNKNFMFVDENVLTFESPEIAYESASLDKAEKCKLRIVGVSKISSVLADSVVDATHAQLPGQNLYNNKYIGALSAEDLDGIISWPMWNEYGLVAKEDAPSDTKQRTPSDYTKNGNVVRYWLHMWNHAGKIDGYSVVDDDGNIDDFSRLKSKVFANLRFCQNTIYNAATGRNPIYIPDSVRIFNQTRSQLTEISIGSETKHYDGVIDEVLMMPTNNTYPILFSTSGSDDKDKIDYQNFLYSDSPVPLTYRTSPHAVISLESGIGANNTYHQRVLPTLFQSDAPVSVPRTSSITGALLPWIIKENEVQIYVYGDYALPTFTYISGSADEGFVSLSYMLPGYTHEIPQGDTTNLFDRLVWEPAINDYAGSPVYTRIIDNNNIVYIVDISKRTIVRSGDKDIVTLSGAKVLASYPGETSTIQVHYILYSDGVGSDEGNKDLNVQTGVLSAPASGTYPYVDFVADYESYDFRPNPVAGSIGAGDQFFFVGELFYDYDSNPDEDPRYGGITDSAVKNNRFIVAGPRYDIVSNDTLYANQGDTYFQRWDNLRTRPLSKDDANGVIDIVSIMLETHINLDGRYDLQRHTRFVASINEEQYGVINRVYSQQDNFISRRDLDSDYNLDQYRSSITWTLDKQDMSDTDEWTHITLANSLKLDGDKGWCRALRRFQNNLIAFQDRGIAEILFNSRTQIATTDGLPIEIANSGKVDGKRYITNKYGCLNKWSIIEGKAGLYFVDNINKMFGKLADGIDNLAARLGFSAFFREINNIEPWNPDDFNNVVSYYDRVHSDIYLVRKDSGSGHECLVYNETIGAFTSFFDYGSVPMMTNIEDRFVSSKSNKLWLQNEGLYCNFFGTQYDYWVWYRATPDPYGDKLWTNIEYRADVYEVLDENGEMLVDESGLISDEYYLANETFDTLSVWNEYQRTAEIIIPQAKIDSYADVRKKFRIWRMDIPRAVITESNKYGFDRIRNPWVNIKFRKFIDSSTDKNQDLMQIHDLNVIYFE